MEGETHGCNSTQLSDERLHFYNFQIYEKMKEKNHIFDYHTQLFKKISLFLFLSILSTTIKAQIGAPIVIGSGTTITFSPQMSPPATVMNGIRVIEKSTLIISSFDIEFFQGARIEVEAGSTLIVRNSTLGVFPGLLPWDGIFVGGNNALSQGRNADGCLDQGKIILEYATIENAVFGVITGAFNDFIVGQCIPVLPHPSTAGGIIEATNTTFRNNLIDVDFRPYQAPGGVDNVSFFNQCRSYITDDYAIDTQCLNDNFNIAPFFRLRDVKGIKIRGHIFEDQRSTTNTASPSDKIGIRTFAASIKLDKFGFGNTNRSKFNNLDYGIYFGGNNLGISTVRNADFESWHGILVQAVSNGVTIYSNNFTVKRTTNPTTPSYGLYLDRCDAYQVKYNTFTAENVNAPADGGVGVIARNQHPNPTMIDNNDFSGFIIATEAIGQNTDQQQGANADGLEYRCNNFSENPLFDIIVAEDLTFDPQSTSVIGIKEYHYLTANRFSENPNALINLYNAPVGLPFRYIHHNDATDGRLSPNVNLGAISVIELDVDYSLNDCPEIFLVNEPDIGTLGDIKETKGDLFNQTLGTLGDLVDNGNTPQMVNWVQTANQPRRAIRAYFKIMQQAPFTSDAVLEEVSKKEVGFSKGMIRNILRNHPQAAKSAQIQENLDNRINQLPLFMRNQINQGLSMLSAKEVMELEANDYKRERDEAINQAVLLLGADTLDRSDEMIDFLSGTDELGFQYRIANIHDQNGEIEQADAILSDISTWELSEKEAADHEACVGLRSLLQAWKAEGKDLALLAEEDLALLHEYAVQPNITAGKAVAILRLNGNTDYPEPVYFPELPTEERRIVEVQDNDVISDISVYPNPASIYLNIRYDLSQHESLSLQIVDITGKVVHQRQLNQSQDEIVLITENYPTGQYILSIYTDNQLIESKKFNIVK